MKKRKIPSFKDISLKKIKSNTLKYIKNNRLFLSYVILNMISLTLLRALTVGNVLNIEFFLAFLFDLSIVLLIGSFGYLFKADKQHIYFLIMSIIYFLICFINGIYYTFYSSFASFSLLSALGQVGEVGDAVIEKLNVIHFIYLIPLGLFFTVYLSLKKKDYFSFVKKTEKGRNNFFATLIVSIIFVIVNCALLDGTTISRLNKQWNREYIVERVGILVYQGNDLVHTLKSKVNTLFGYDEAYRQFVDYYENREEKVSDNKYSGIFKGKNVVFVHMESMMNFFVNLKINNVEITPTLNKLTKEGLYFSNFYPEISVGTSSDTEFTLNTSLLPVTSGTVFVSYYNRYYESIEKLLKDKGYYTFSMHANKASMWNRDKMHPNLGYDDMYFEDSYNIDEIVGLGLSDNSFFKQIIPILTKIENENKNYMGTIITLSNHTPFDDLDMYGDLDLSYKKEVEDESGNKEEIVYDYLENTKLGNYIKSAHYADLALGKFIDYLYENDIMNNTVFVFYGDHDAKLSKSEFNRYYNYDFETGKIKEKTDPTYVDYDYYENELNRKTPLIFWTKDKKVKKEIKYYMGMIDVLPTLSNMLNIKPNYALGHDIFETKWNNIIPFPNGNFLTKKVYYNSNKEEYKPLTNDPIDEEYIEKCKEYTEKIIELSNDIIVHNLIYNYEESLEK